MTADSLLAGLVVLCMPWALLEAASRLRLRISILSSDKGVGIPRPRLISRNRGSAATTRFSRGPLWIKVETTRFNELPGMALRWIGRRPDRRRRDDDDDERREVDDILSGRQQDNVELRKGPSAMRPLEHLYDAGTIFAGLALVGSLAFLIWGAFDLIDQISQLNGSSSDPARLEKRDVREEVRPRSDDWSPSLVPLIPGLTLPWSHLLPLSIALLFTQVVHEAGHALCGALQSWQPVHTGFVLLFPCIPGAFVTLPKDAVEEDDEDDEDDGADPEAGYLHKSTVGHSSLDLTRKRLRNISAGVWHNAITVVVMAAIMYSGVGSTMHALVSSEVDGLLVEAVDQTSPLVHHLAPGTLITRLDDTNLTKSPFKNAGGRRDAWVSLLRDEKITQQERLGWCIASSIWDVQSTQCCQRPATDSKKEADSTRDESICFRSFDASAPQSAIGRCYDPLVLVSAGTRHQRCTGLCPDDKDCIMPDSGEHLLRITVRETQNRSANMTTTRVVLFQGSPKAVFAAVKVSPTRLRLGWLLDRPYRAFLSGKLLFSYIFNLSLAMALLNMLPLPLLDGDVYMRVVLRELALRSRLLRSKPTEMGDIDPEGQGAINSHRLRSRRSESPVEQRHSSVADGEPHTTRFSPPRRRAVDERTLAKVHRRIHWFTIILAGFVFGGSILLHIVRDTG